MIFKTARTIIALLLLVKFVVCWDCSHIKPYNDLVNLVHDDNCMNVDLVFQYLEDINLQGHVNCRIQAIHVLSDHFGSNPTIPQKCSCKGYYRLQEYHQGSGDGVSDIKDHCLRNSHSYRDLYNQFFEHQGSSNNHIDCRTHHSVWNYLRHIPTYTYNSNSCQKDIIFHLSYAFENHPDHCVCTATSPHSNGHTAADPCSQYSSYNRLLELGAKNDCLSANSVWHYLDDLQVKSVDCRKKIQHHMADKYQHATSQDNDGCSCHAHVALQDHEIYRITNGSLFDCRDHTGGSTYLDIDQRLFSNIQRHGCTNHNFLWPNLENVKHYCQHGSCVDCQQDLIVRAALKFPSDHSDSCVCSKIHTASHQQTSPSTKTTTTTRPSTTTTPTTRPSPTTMPNTPPPQTTVMVSATSKKVIQSSATVPTTTQPMPVLKFTCSKLAVIEDIAKSIKATDPNSSYCNPAAGGSDDAYILSTCNMPSPMTWKRGVNVLADCQSGNPQIPTYTPVSTFDTENYASQGAQSGIFLGCYNSGIKIAVQKCNSVPEILNIENGAFANNPGNYYVIV